LPDKLLINPRLRFITTAKITKDSANYKGKFFPGGITNAFPAAAPRPRNLKFQCNSHGHTLPRCTVSRQKVANQSQGSIANRLSHWENIFLAASQSGLRLFAAGRQVQLHATFAVVLRRKHSDGAA
jgi:hypothetical protein